MSRISSARSGFTTPSGFETVYDRPTEGFAFLQREGAQLMVERIGAGRAFLADPAAPLAPPLGRGVNFQISVSDVRALSVALQAAGATILLPLEEKWYAAGVEESGVRQCVVADPDGYLLRFSEGIGRRPTDADSLPTDG